MGNEVATLGLDDEEVENEKEEVGHSSLVHSQLTGFKDFLFGRTPGILDNTHFCRYF